MTYIPRRMRYGIYDTRSDDELYGFDGGLRLRHYCEPFSVSREAFLAAERQDALQRAMVTGNADEVDRIVNAQRAADGLGPFPKERQTVIYIFQNRSSSTMWTSAGLTAEAALGKLYEAQGWKPAACGSTYRVWQEGCAMNDDITIEIRVAPSYSYKRL